MNVCSNAQLITMGIMMMHFATAANYPVKNVIANIYAKHAQQEYCTTKYVLIRVPKGLF